MMTEHDSHAHQVVREGITGLCWTDRRQWAGLQGLPGPLGWGVGRWHSGVGGLCLSLSPQAQWDCVNSKYKQKKRDYKNSGVVILADLKVSLSPGCRPPAHPRCGAGVVCCLSSAESKLSSGRRLWNLPIVRWIQGLCAPNAWRWVREMEGEGKQENR